jgi:hypothetical protein
VLIAVVAYVAGCAGTPAPTGSARPDTWARPVSACPGVPNIYRVNATLYRSAQPTKDGFIFLNHQRSLREDDLPIKTVLSLRTSDDDKRLMPAGSALRREQIYFKPWHPENEDVVKFLRIVTTPSLQPVLVHCLHGSDRTGTMIAVYRIVVEGWSKDQAIREMLDGGYGFHPLWQNLVRYIEGLNISMIKAEVAKQGAWE